MELLYGYVLLIVVRLFVDITGNLDEIINSYYFFICNSDNIMRDYIFLNK